MLTASRTSLSWRRCFPTARLAVCSCPPPDERIGMRATFFPPRGLRIRPGIPASDAPERRDLAGRHRPGPGWRGRDSALLAVVLIATAGFGALVQGPIWSQDPALAGANLTVSVLFVLTGWMLRREPGQRGVGWALMLTGLLRPMDFADAGTAPPWAAYDLLFGAATASSAPMPYCVTRIPRCCGRSGYSLFSSPAGCWRAGY